MWGYRCSRSHPAGSARARVAGIAAVALGMQLAAGAARGDAPSDGARANTAPAPADLVASLAHEFSAAVVLASASGWADREVRALAGLYTADAILFPPRGEPIRGAAAIRAYWTRTRERRILEHTVYPERIDAADALIVEHGRVELLGQQGSAAPARSSLTYISVWRRDADGAWRKHLDSWW